VGHGAHGQPGGELVIAYRPAGQLGELSLQSLDAHEQPPVLDQELVPKPASEPDYAKRPGGTKRAENLQLNHHPGAAGVRPATNLI
jgi:hypothetical protein